MLKVHFAQTVVAVLLISSEIVAGFERFFKISSFTSLIYKSPNGISRVHRKNNAQAQCFAFRGGAQSPCCVNSCDGFAVFIGNRYRLRALLQC